MIPHSNTTWAGKAVPDDFRLPWNTTRTMADVWAPKRDTTPRAPVSNRRTPWTHVKTAALALMWADGLSCSNIAKVLGAGFTRNSVIGKVQRMDLPRRRPQRPHGRWSVGTARYAGSEE